MKQSEVIKRLKTDKVICVETGDRIGYSNYYRFLSDGVTFNVKTFTSLISKGMIIPVIVIPKTVAIMKSYQDKEALQIIKNYLTDDEDDLDPAGGHGLYSHI